MKGVYLLVMLLLYSPLPRLGQRLVNPRTQNDDDDDDDEIRHALSHQEVLEDDADANATGKGLYLGAPCERNCHPKLLHVYCNPNSGMCECEKNYPVKLHPYTGCGKPKRLGDQCYYREACQYTDQNSACVQVHHNAICQCKDGYHSVSIPKSSKRVFCAEDLVVMTTDFSTFAGVLSGIALLSGLLCFVLRLFNQNLYGPRRHRFGNANLPPPILFSSDPGSLPMPIIGRRSSTSRTSSRGTLTSSRRASSIHNVSACRQMASRAGSRRPSLTSVHSSNSVKSYSQRRYEREREQKEEREMQRRLARMSSVTNSNGKIAPSPSPHSTDDLLPTLEEDKQIPPLAIQEESTSSFQEDMPSTSKQFPQ